MNTAKTDVVLIIDEVQQALATGDGYSLMRPEGRTRPYRETPAPKRPGTSSSWARVAQVLVGHDDAPGAAFTGALAAGYQVLDQDFVNWLLQRVATSPGVSCRPQQWPGRASRPWATAPRCSRHWWSCSGSARAAESGLSIICSTLASAAADVELHAVEEFGALGKALFSKIAAGSRARHQRPVRRGRPGGIRRPDQVRRRDQPGADPGEMIATNLITRLGHGVYAVADPPCARSGRRMALSVAGAAAAKPAKPV